MLRTLMEMKLFVYGMFGVGGFSVLLMLIMNKVFAKNVFDKESYQKTIGKFRVASIIGGVICTGLTIANTVGTFQLRYLPIVRYQQILMGIGVLVGLYCVERLIEFSTRERLTSDFIFENMETILELRSRDKPIATRELEALDQTLDVNCLDHTDTEFRDSVESMNQGLKETAASKSKFNRFLTPEEEEIMREVIREYMT